MSVQLIFNFFEDDKGKIERKNKSLMLPNELMWCIMNFETSLIDVDCILSLICISCLFFLNSICHVYRFPFSCFANEHFHTH
jgi:hypothetical protein